MRKDICICGEIKDSRSKVCMKCKPPRQRWSEEEREKHKKYWNEQHITGNPDARRGFKQTDEHKRNQQKSRGTNYSEIKMSGSRWKYFIWSKKVKSRDIVCVYCGSNENLHAHHILSKNKHPELSLSINNGITLCHSCHWNEHKLNGYL